MTAPLAITPGEPAGIGPELLVRTAQRDRAAAWVAIADREVLRRAADRLGLPLSLDDSLRAPTSKAGCLTVAHVPLEMPETPGVLAVASAGYVIATLERAVAGCLSGEFGALVTGPVQKSIINDAGIRFSGHTEFLCERAGVPDVVMLLVAGTLRVALATTHLPLAAVPGAITPELLRRRLTILLTALKDVFGLERPRVLVAGLNPHAGEGGHLGREEIEIIEPVCREARERGEDVQGPLPADTIFTPAMLEGAAAVLAMYHDQGLPVLKHQGFGRAVNVTLGLPFVRTSVDHGTALDLAGRGVADPGSFTEALRLAERLAG
jgi:4-hydroxythreonine-4-phosphate dehydrogenase